MKTLSTSCMVLGCVLLFSGAQAHAAASVRAPESLTERAALPEIIPPNDPRRAAIFESVRKPVEAQLQRPVTFVVRALQMQDGFAFAQLRALTAEGKPVDLAPLATGWHGDAATLSVLLHRDANRGWVVIALQVGIQVRAWAAQYGAPSGLFPPDD